jgi:phage baseplate assembly protein W
MALGGIEQFFKKVPAKKSVPCGVKPKITQSGDFLRTEGIDEIIRSLSTLLLIIRGSYIFDPQIGTEIYRYVFEPVDYATKTGIEQEVSQTIFSYENRAEISHEVLFFKNKKGFRVNIYVNYHGEKGKVSIDIDETLLRTIGN